jgi:hypothetical protein
VSEREVSDSTDVDWSKAETSRHHDHVVAHVVGATVLGYFVRADALYLLLDIGFIWIVYLDAEMGLVPESLAISELETDANFCDSVAADADALRSQRAQADALAVMCAAPAGCLVEEVAVCERGTRRRLFVRGETSSLVIETSIDTGEIVVKEN